MHNPRSSLFSFGEKLTCFLCLFWGEFLLKTFDILTLSTCLTESGEIVLDTDVFVTDDCR